jgi:hypothetical protein
MCTLVFGLGVLGHGSVLVATNRDEHPARAGEPPQVLRRAPLVVGGRDPVAGGTWLAVRAGAAGRGPAVAMLLNRFDADPERSGRRSRGLLTLDVAASDDPLATARELAATGRYAPCSLVWLSGEEGWLLALRGDEAPELERIAPGWHALAHRELDDAADERTAWLAARLRGFAPSTRPEAAEGLRELLATHAAGSVPAVCLHEGRAPTVSAETLWIAPGELEYRHAQGRPCVTVFEDHTSLLAR